MVKKNIEQTLIAPVTFSDLSGSLKTLVVLAWIVVGCFVLAFMTGFIMGAAGL